MRGLASSSALALLLAGAVASAQTPPAPDSARRDSTAADTTLPRWRRSTHTGRPCAYQGVDMPLQLVAVELAIAPPLLLSTPSLIMCRPDEKFGPTVGFARSHVAVYGVAAENAVYDSSGAVYSGSVEALWRGAFAEVRTQHIVFPHSYSYRIVHGGYLAHPWPGLMGGLTVGYRSVPALPRHEGVEVAFPLIAGNERAWARLETSYVAGRHMTSWNGRLQGEWVLRGGPLIAGFNIEAITLPLSRTSRPAAVPIGILLGARF